MQSESRLRGHLLEQNLYRVRFKAPSHLPTLRYLAYSTASAAFYLIPADAIWR
jgi:hypothetical protein